MKTDNFHIYSCHQGLSMQHAIKSILKRQLKGTIGRLKTPVGELVSISILNPI